MPFINISVFILIRFSKAGDSCIVNPVKDDFALRKRMPKFLTHRLFSHTFLKN